MTRSFDAIFRRLALPLFLSVVVAIGLWKWIVDGNIEGLIGIGVAIIVLLAMEFIKRRADRPYRD